MMVIHSEDDPVTPIHLFKEELINLVKNKKNINFYITKYGGHCAFMENLYNDYSTIDKIILDF